MTDSFKRWLAPACASLWCGAALAAPTAAPPDAPDPLDARAPVPTLSHRSALTGYQPLRGPTALPWREANDQVGRIGGWRAYAREAAEADTARAAAAAQAKADSGSHTHLGSHPGSHPSSSPGTATGHSANVGTGARVGNGASAPPRPATAPAALTTQPAPAALTAQPAPPPAAAPTPAPERPHGHRH